MGPSALGLGQILVEHGLARAIAVQAGPLFGLELEQLQDPHRLAGGRHHPQIPLGGGQHQARRRRLEHLDAPVDEQGQQLHDVELVDERIGQPDQGLGQQRLPGHGLILPADVAP